ncbi:hypothetical protein GQR58_025152 [Nymphon striatum]|nr:hypothetical protein GQR58_025152 [Nymphon striatum]
MARNSFLNGFILLLDDIIISLATVLNKVSSSQHIILGGDLNLHPESENFTQLCQFLASYGVSLLSNPSEHTYIHLKGSSCIDYIFTSRNIHYSSASVLSIMCSDHLPIQVKARLPRSKNYLKVTAKLPLAKALDLDSAAIALHNLDPNISSENLISSINEILLFNSRQKTHHRKYRNPWYSPYLASLRNDCLRLRFKSKSDPSFLPAFCIARNAYYKHIRNAKRLHGELTAEKLTQDAQQNGIRSLCRHAKSKRSTSAIPLHNLLDYSIDLFSSNSPAPELYRLTSCRQQEHFLLSPVSLQEVESTLKGARTPPTLTESSRVTGFATELHFHTETDDGRVRAILYIAVTACRTERKR